MVVFESEDGPSQILIEFEELNSMGCSLARIIKIGYRCSVHLFYGRHQILLPCWADGHPFLSG